MSARLFILAIMVVVLLYDLAMSLIADAQRKKPLPPEVADIYEPERYQTYLAYVAANRKAAFIEKAVDLVVTAVVVLSPVFAGIEGLTGGNVYLTLLLSFLLFWGISLVSDTAFSYYDTFHIEQRFGLNKRDLREFVKDTVLEQLGSFVLVLGLTMLLAFIAENLGAWTHGFQLGLMGSLLVCVAIVAVLGVFLILAQVFSYAMMRLQYTFTPLPDGGLRGKIEGLMRGCRKKVAQIYVYNESAKTTTKNAFLLKLLWHREFGFADNFLDENSQGELLAVLSHEIGHLKHRRNALNYLMYLFLALVFCGVVALVAQPAPVLFVAQWVRDSFGLAANNYYLLFTVLMYCVAPVYLLLSVFNNYRSRSEEYEADRQAVGNGFGAELECTFRTLSTDELVNVNPHPLIEFLEYDHPGMYRRIKAIDEAMAERESRGEGV